MLRPALLPRYVNERRPAPARAQCHQRYYMSPWRLVWYSQHLVMLARLVAQKAGQAAHRRKLYSRNFLISRIISLRQGK